MWIIWILFCFGWSLYDSVVVPSNWSNFTSWVWFLQAVFFSLHLLSLTPIKKLHPQKYFLSTYFLPVLFGYEFVTMIAVVYMTVDEAMIFENAVQKNGKVVVWIGNFALHFLTLIILLIYISLEYTTITTHIKFTYTCLKWKYCVLLFLPVFIFINTYCAIFVPARHYGVANVGDRLTSQLFHFFGLLGVGLFFRWAVHEPTSSLCPSTANSWHGLP